MNGFELLTRAARMLGFELPDEGMKLVGATCIGQIMSDLGFVPINSLSEEVGISCPECQRALLVGTAMLLAGSIGDLATKESLSADFAAARAAAKGRTDRVRESFIGGDCE